MKAYDKWIGLFFGLAIVLFVIAMTRETFFDWAFARHQNQWSWYLRPLFLIPFCYFAYQRSWAGVMISLFALLTSMFWFPQPDEVHPQVQEFLAFEKQYLTGNWTWQKIFLAFTVPISLTALAAAFWKRSIWIGLAVIVLMAMGKILWSVQNAGEAGTSIIIPAVLGLVLCAGLIAFGFWRMQKKQGQ